MNKINPEVEIELDGEKKKLVLTHNALFALEETEGANFIAEAAEEVEQGKLSLRSLIVLLWACLLETHEEFDVREKDQLRAVRRTVARWITDTKVREKAGVSVIVAMMNSSVVNRDDDGVPVDSKKTQPSLETGSEK